MGFGTFSPFHSSFLSVSLSLEWRMFVNPLRSLEDNKPRKEPNKTAAGDKVCDFFNDVWEK